MEDLPVLQPGGGGRRRVGHASRAPLDSVSRPVRIRAQKPNPLTEAPLRDKSSPVEP